MELPAGKPIASGPDPGGSAARSATIWPKFWTTARPTPAATWPSGTAVLVQVASARTGMPPGSPWAARPALIAAAIALYQIPICVNSSREPPRG